MPAALTPLREDIHHRWRRTTQGRVNVTLQEKRSGRGAAFLALAAEYGNAGDLALVEAQEQLIKRLHPGQHIYVVPLSAGKWSTEFIARTAQSGDTIYLSGGGNLGSLYPDIQFLREHQLKAVPNLATVMMPHSIADHDHLYSRFVRRRFSAIARRHSALGVIARDHVTHEVLHKTLGASVRLAPDPVLAWEPSRLLREQAQRADSSNRLVLMLRQDSESVVGSWAGALCKTLSLHFAITCADMSWPAHGLSRDEGRYAVAGTLQLLRSADCIITDRLHGVVLATNLGIPCLWFDNSTKKVSAFVKTWLANIRWIEPGRIDSLADQAQQIAHQRPSPQEIAQARESFTRILLGVLAEVKRSANQRAGRD